MGRFIICTVGTSLLTNRDDRPWGGWRAGGTGALPAGSEVAHWFRDADLVKASAETNTLRALGFSSTDQIAFLHSDTPEGALCAESLAAYFHTQGCMTETHRLGRLGYGAAAFTTGLKSLVSITLLRVKHAQERQQEVILCATGGFKAEIAFLNILGALLEIEVVYLHELHRDLVRLPRLPLQWDAEFVSQHEAFFSWIDDEEPRTSVEVESWLHGNPQLRNLVEDDDKGFTYLSAAGDLLYRAAKERRGQGPRAEWPAADSRPPSDKFRVSAISHHRPEGWEKFVNRLCAIDCVTSVRYEQAIHRGPKVQVIDAETGAIGVRFGKDDLGLPLRVDTTAQGAAQTELVVRYLSKLK